MWFLKKKKRDVVVVDDGGYYRNLREEIDDLGEKFKKLEKMTEKANDFINEQVHINRTFYEANRRMKSDVDSLKKRAD